VSSFSDGEEGRRRTEISERAGRHLLVTIMVTNVEDLQYVLNFRFDRRRPPSSPSLNKVQCARIDNHSNGVLDWIEK
jgi:hypothetical protein